MVRAPAVAGQFYPAHPGRLKQDLAEYLAPADEPIDALGCVVPHAGYMYSGRVAGAVYGAVRLPSLFLILCPNHTGQGEAFAIMSSGEWQTPLGCVPIDGELAAALKRGCPALREDAAAHADEHSLEVQLPFLQYCLPQMSFVPIAVGPGEFASLEEFGRTLGQALAGWKRPLLVIASSDMDHYEPDEVARAKDRRAIEAILALDPRRLYSVLRQDRNSMCGYGPVIAMLYSVRRLGADAAKLVRYATSADAGGRRNAVVGYAGIAVYKAVKS
jgi:AmmeMemoRadiSam system protein B